MAYSKLLKVVKQLGTRTSEGSVAWEETGKEGVFQASFPNYSVRISRSWHDFEESYDYYLRLYNQNGSVIEEVTQAGLAGPDLSGPEAYQLLEELYEGARRKAMGVDQALDTILDNLDDDVKF